MATPELDAPGDPESVARIICLRLLEHRARTRSELATALAGKGVPPAAATAVLDRFTELGLIDDQAFAVDFATARHRQRHLAPRAITAQLRQRGVAPETIEAAVADIDEHAQAAAARDLVEARLRRLDGLDAAVVTRRLTGLLARKGYSSQLAYATVREALQARGTADQDLGELPIT